MSTKQGESMLPN